ncbi:MAG: YidH family protein [Pseudonocardia sp.]
MGGVAVVQLVPEFGLTGARHVIGVVLAALGVAVSVGSLVRWHRVQPAMERDEDLPPTRMPLLLGAALAVLGVVVGSCSSSPVRPHRVPRVALAVLGLVLALGCAVLAGPTGSDRAKRHRWREWRSWSPGSRF